MESTEVSKNMRDRRSAHAARRLAQAVVALLCPATGPIEADEIGCSGGLCIEVERAALPGVVRAGRGLLVRRHDLLRWLDESRAPSPK